MPPRVMLVLPTATYRAAAFLDAAASLGLDCVVASDEAPTLARMMEGRSLTIALGDPEQAVARAAEFAERWPVDAVVGVDEASVLTAAHIAARLGVGSNPVNAIAATRDKRRLRSLLAGAGVRQPRWIETRAAAGEAAACAAVAGLPCVVKPVHLAASRGVVRADTVDDLAAAMDRVDRLLRRPELCGDRDRPLLVEEYIDGAEVAVEGLLRDGRLTVLAVFDKPDPLEGPFFAETLYVTPSRHPAALVAEAERLTARAVAAIGLVDGPVHAEVRLAADGPVFLEVAARSIGGRCSSAVRVVDGEREMSLEELILRAACDLPVADPTMAPGAAGVVMLPVPRTGVVSGVRGVAAAAAVPSVIAVDVTVPAGERVEALPEGERYLGFITARGGGPEAVEAALRQAWSLLDLTIEPG